MQELEENAQSFACELSAASIYCWFWSTCGTVGFGPPVETSAEYNRKPASLSEFSDPWQNLLEISSEDGAACP